MISDTPCPRCGCFIVKKFECGCGAVHSDYCNNCGRWTTLLPTEYAALGDIDARCEAGRVPHEHSSEEKTARIAAHIARLRREHQVGN